MNLRFPLYAKILVWFFLNLLVLGAAFYVVFQIQFRTGMGSFLMTQASDRIQAISEVIHAELNATPNPAWNDVLKRFRDAYQIQFYLFASDGRQVAGETIELPAEILAKVTERRGLFPGRGPPPGRGPNRSPVTAPVEPHPKFMLHTIHPSRYWMGVWLPPSDREPRRLGPVTLLTMSSSLRGGGLFFEATPWLVAGFGGLLFSLLFWFPLVRGITRSITQMTRATEQIAEGRFDTQVQAGRRDELGRLGQAINRMAVRLAGFVTGQKRFLGDIAHELCAPIARLQVALGILEQRADDKQQAYVEDVREEVQQVSSLVNELLSFSKAGLQQKSIKLEPVNLAAIVRRVIEREAPGSQKIQVLVDDSLDALAEPDLLARALANLVRNALGYAGAAGPVVISAAATGDQLTLTVADSGPGVPPETLEQIFDPFFRGEPSRSRDTGGAGLGLAIVKTCVEACQGSVTARNRQPSGLQVDLVLKGASRNEEARVPSSAD